VYHTKKFTVDNHIGINSLYIYISNSDEIIIDLCNIDSYESYKMGGGVKGVYDRRRDGEEYS